MKNMPGEEDTHVEILRAVEGIEDEDVRKKAVEALKANDAGISKALETRGARGDIQPESDSPEGQLDELAKDRAKDRRASPTTRRTTKVLETPAGQELYGKIGIKTASSD